MSKQKKTYKIEVVNSVRSDNQEPWGLQSGVIP